MGAAQLASASRAILWKVATIDPDDLEEVLYETSDRFRTLIESRRAAARARAIPLDRITKAGAIRKSKKR